MTKIFTGAFVVAAVLFVGVPIITGLCILVIEWSMFVLRWAGL